VPLVRWAGEEVERIGRAGCGPVSERNRSEAVDRDRGAVGVAQLSFVDPLGHSGLQRTFAVMLLPLAASVYYLFTGMHTYPRDVATAAAVGRDARR
jgi:hypothetical protein